MDKTDKKEASQKAIPLLKSAVNSLFEHKEILFPYCLIIFIQILILEILYFLPRWPLNVFFGPIIGKLWSESYLHYPFNFLLLPKLFQWCQIPIYVLISGFCICLSVSIITRINNGKPVMMKAILRDTFSWYVQIVVISLISYLLVLLFFKLYEPIFNRALLIRSQNGIFFLIKQTVILGAPYFNLFLSVLANTLLAYVFPIIIIEKKKFWSALVLNFKLVFKIFWFTFLVVAVPALFFIPILVLRSSLATVEFMPEITLLALIFSTFVTISIDAVVYTALTTAYLIEKENT